MNKNSKIYVAGHKGMVGSSLIRLLQSRGYNNIITRSRSDLDLTRQKDVENLFKTARPEYVFLAAAKVGGILANNTYKAEFIYQNIMISANVIESAYKNGVTKLLNLGSSCIYPKLAQQPMSEEFLLSGPLEPTNEPYAIAKIAALKMCRYYFEQYGMNCISVMPTNLYGPNDDFNLETAHVLPAFLRKFHLARLLRNKDYEAIKRDFQRNKIGFNLDQEIALQNDKTIKSSLEKIGITEDAVTLWGSGEAFREFMHVDDLADACIYLMMNFDYQDIGEVLNVGTGEDIKIKDIARLIKSIVDFPGDIRFDVSKPEGTPRKLLDVRRIKKFGWQATTGIEDGIKKTYGWYCNA
jgi:GDP-L-fucose synthase